MVDQDVQPPDGTIHGSRSPGPADTTTLPRNGSASREEDVAIRAGGAPDPSTEPAAPDEAPQARGSRYGAGGSFLKRVIERLTRFQTVRQDAVNAQLAAQSDRLAARNDELAAQSRRLAAQIAQLEAAPGEIVALRRDLAAVAVDFGAVADRMRAFENTRRTVDRMAVYRFETRNQRRQIAELREHLGALSARLTFFGREGTPLRSDLFAMRAEVAALRVEGQKLDDFVRATQSAGRDTSERLDAIAGEAEERARLDAATEASLAALREEVAQISAASAGELERRLSEITQRLSELIEARGQTNEAALAALRSEAAANADASQRALGDRIDDGLRTNAALRAALDAASAEAVADRQRSADVAGRVEAAERLLADIAGAINSMRDAAVAERAAAAEGSEGAAAVHSELERLAADLAALRGRLLATPYMSAPPDAWPELRRSTPDDFDYVGFENVFRGPESFIRQRLRAYLPLVEKHAPIVELGSGRGEFLELMRESGIAATGVDRDEAAVARMHAKGLDNAVAGDANAYLAGLAEGSVGAIFSAQFAEHLPFAELLRCLELARERLVPGGLFIAETVNANSIEAWKTFYVDPSHEKPLFPEVFQFLCRSMGFSQVRVFYPNGGGFDEAEPTSQHEYAVVATAPNRDGSQREAGRSRSDPGRRRTARPPE